MTRRLDILHDSSTGEMRGGVEGEEERGGKGGEEEEGGGCFVGDLETRGDTAECCGVLR